MILLWLVFSISFQQLLDPSSRWIDSGVYNKFYVYFQVLDISFIGRVYREDFSEIFVNHEMQIDTRIYWRIMCSTHFID